MANDTRRKLYTALNNAGFDIGSYEDFDRRMNNQADRKKFYDAVSNAGYDIGDYDAFNKRITPSKYSLKIKGVNTPVSEKEYKDFVSKHQGQTSQPAKTQTTAAKQPRTQPAAQAKQAAAPAPATQQAPTPLTPQQKMGYSMGVSSMLNSANNAVQGFEEGVKNRAEYRKQQPLGGGVVKKTKRNLETGETEDTYLTSTGAETDNQYVAETSQRAINKEYREPTVDEQLAQAYAERDRLNNEMSKNPVEWVDQDGRVHYAGGREGDENMQSLEAAYRQNEERIRTLTYEKNNAGFWQHLGTELGDVSSWNPYNAMSDATALLRTKQKIDSGQTLDTSDNLLLANTLLNKEAHAKYDKNRGDWFRAGGIAAESIRLLPDFAIGMGPMKGIATGVAKGTTKLVTKAIGKNVAERLAGKILTRTLGVGAGSLAAGAAMANTVQLPRLASETMKNMTGELTLDKQGNYQFEDGNNFLTSALKAEQTLIPEAASEVTGEFLPGVGSALEAVGLRKIAGGLSRLQGTKWYKGYSKALEHVGFHGAPGEALEEYLGDVYSLVLGDPTGIVGDENGKGGWGDLDKHIDILLGTATLGGLLHAPSLLHTGYRAEEYLRYGHKKKLADKEGRRMMGSAAWDGIRKAVDSSTNENISDIVTGIFKDWNLTTDGRKAVLDYATNLQKQRGHLMAIIADNKDEESQPEEKQAAEVLDNSYTSGYEAGTPEEKQAISQNLETATQNLESLGEGFANWVKDESNPPMAVLAYMMAHRDTYTDEQIAIASDYYQSKFAANGMAQSEADNAELEGEQQVKPIYTTMEQADGQFTVNSFDKNGNLVGQEVFDTEDEANAYRGEVRMQKDHLDLQDYYTKASAEPTLTEQIASFEDEQGWEPGTVEQLVNSDPMQMSDIELQMADVARGFLSGLAYPSTEVHTEHSNQEGVEAAENADIDTDTPNEEVISSVVAPYIEAEENLKRLFEQNEELAEEVQYYEQMGKSEQEIISMLDNFSPKEVQTVIDFYNAQARFEGFMNRSQEKIEERVKNERSRRTFKGTINGEANVTDLIEITDGQNNYTLVNGSIEIGDNGQVTNAQGVIIALDGNGDFVSLGANSSLAVLPSETTLDTWEQTFREQLQLNASNAIDPTGALAAGVIPPTESEDAGEGGTEEAPAGAQVAGEDTEGGNAGGEAGAEGTGGNEPPAAAPVTIESVTDEDGVKHYEDGISEEDAVADMIASGDNPIEIADASIAEADEAIKTINDKPTKTRKDLANRKKHENVKKYYEDIKSHYVHTDRADGTSVTQIGNRTLIEKDGKIIYDTAGVYAPIPTADILNPPTGPETPPTPPADETPDVMYDTPAAARERGYIISEGHRIDRQEEKPMPTGKEVEVQYSTKDKVKGHLTVSELGEVQGSHLTNGQRNLKHYFLSEAQPKGEFGSDRQTAAQVNASEENFRPELMLTFNDTQSAYSGSTAQTNRRGEVIQGNGRRNLAEYIYAPGNEAVAKRYKEYLMAHAEELGTTAEEIAKMEKPFAHIVLDVTDEEAIRLGQFTAQDLETGGKKVPDVTTTITKLGDSYGSFANIVLEDADPDASLAERIEGNAERAIKWLNQGGYINDTEAKTLLEDKSLARQFVKDMITDTLFRGASPELRSMFYELPKNIQSAIVSVVGREVTMNQDTTILKDIQESILAFHELMSSSPAFAKAKGRTFEERYNAVTAAVNDWLRQLNIDGSENSKKYSNFALELAKRYKSYTDQKTLRSQLQEYYDLVSGASRQLNMFEEEPVRERLSREAAIKKVFGINNEENGEQGVVPLAGDDTGSEEGGQGQSGDTESGEQEPEGEQPAVGGRGDTGDAGEGVAQTREEYLASHPLTEAQIMADTEATEDEKLNAIDFLKGEDDSAISRFYYDSIYNRAQEKTEKDSVDKPLESLSEVKKFMDEIGYKGSLSRVMTDNNGKKFVKYQASGNVTPNIVFGETTRRDVYQQFHNYRNVMDVDIPSNVEAEFERADASLKETRDALYASDRDEIKGILTEAGIPFTDVIDSERGSRIVFTDKKNDNGNYTEWMDVSDPEQAREDIAFIKAKAERYKADPMEAIEQAANAFREEQKAKDQQDIDDALREFEERQADAEPQPAENGDSNEIAEEKTGQAAPSMEEIREAAGVEETAEEPKKEEGKNPSGNKLVTDERYEELKKRMRDKLLGQMNVGVDPEILAIGVEMAVYHIEKGARKFADYARGMIKDLGDVIRPYLKAFYNGARDLPEMDEYASEMDDYQTVQSFDVANFDKTSSDPMEQAKEVRDEEKVNKDVQKAKENIKVVAKENKKKKNNVSSQRAAKQQQDLFNLNTEEDEQQVRRDEGLPAEQGSGSESEGQEGGEPERVREGGSSEQNRPLQSGLSDAVEETEAEPQPQEKKNQRNNRNERGKDYAPTSATARVKANIAAIKLLKQLEAEDRDATREEMAVLKQYSGWGGLGGAFNENSPYYNEVRDLFDDAEYDSAAMSINSAYYTPASVIDRLWDVATKLGFKGGNILESSAGIGNIIASIPESMNERSDIEMVEIDSISGRILAKLYPDAKVNIKGFEDTRVENGSVDLAITNVPFVTGLKVRDEVDTDLSRQFGNIHDFVIAKNIRKLKEGGIGIFITTSNTLDKSDSLREWIDGKGDTDVMGVFRLNNETFGGTNVTSDIIVVRKRVNGERHPDAIDVKQSSVIRDGEYENQDGKYDWKTGKYETKRTSMRVNNYLNEHPEDMGGEMAFGYEKGDTFRPGSYGLYPSEKNQEQLLDAWVRKMKNVFAAVTRQRTRQEDTDVREGRMFVKDGKIYVSQQGKAVPYAAKKAKVKGKSVEECVKDYVAIRESLGDVLKYQLENESDAGLKPLLDKLNKAYDNFVKKYGYLHKNVAISFLRDDIEFPDIAALENYSESKDIEGNKIVKVGKSKVFEGRVLRFKTEPKPQSVKDGVLASVQQFGKIDLGWIAQNVPGQTEASVRAEILNSGYGFEDPVTKKVEVRYEYLSGNVREKLRQARENNTDGRYNKNIEALEKVMPMDIPAHLIDFSLGSSWIDPKLYEDFVKDKYGCTVRLVNVGGVWSMEVLRGEYDEKNRAGGVHSELLGDTIPASKLFEAAINNRTYKVQRTFKEWDGSKRTETDKAATQACQNRIGEIKDEFNEWAKGRMQTDVEMAEKMMRVYNDKFNSMVPKEVDDTFVPDHFDGAVDYIHLYPHQSKAVMRAVTEPVMLAHQVGAGKTFTLITTAMEMRRLGTAKKPMIVVQNATVGQFVAAAKTLYPNAKILSLTERDRDAEGRRSFYGKIKYNDWDMIVIPQSTFERIPDSPERQEEFIQEKIDDKLHALEAARIAKVDDRLVKQMEREIDDLEQERDDIALGREPQKGKKGKKKDEEKTKKNTAARAKEQLDRHADDVMYFDDMGIDALLIDEAHEYKRLGFSTTMGRGVKGIDPAGSKKAAGVYLKIRGILKNNGWKNVVFATGTPISNTAAEIWTFMKYLMPKEVMMEQEIWYFDDFVHNFGKVAQSLEFATNGKFKENTRFAAYINKPELIRIWSTVADTVLAKDMPSVAEKLPEKENGKDQDVFLPQTQSLIGIMRAVRKRLEEFEKMSGAEKRANSSIPLVMYGLAKRAAIDPRLVEAGATDEPNSKTNKAAEEIVKDLASTDSYKGTVAVFCDMQNGPEGFNIFQEMKRKLVEKGVPESKIAIITSGMTITQKEKIFEQVNSGDIRVIMGSTQTLGTGVNIQERLHLLIHMDAPDRPMDYTQRNGRILRQGNLHKEWGRPIRILRFGVEDSLDVTSYQRLKTKSGFIDSIMDGKGALANNQVDRTLEEEEEGLFDNPVAVLSGSQYALKKTQAERELRKWQSKRQQWEADQIYIENTLRRNKGQNKEAEERIKEYDKQIELAKKHFPDGKAKTITIKGVETKTEEELQKALTEQVNKPIRERVDSLRNDRTFTKGTVKIPMKFDDVDVNVEVEIERETEYVQGKGMKTTMHTTYSYTIPALGLSEPSIERGFIKDIINDIKEDITAQTAIDRKESAEKGIEKRKADNEQLEARRSPTFKDEDKLAAAREKVTEYTAKMKEEMAEKEAKYAAMDAEVVDIDAIEDNAVEEDDNSDSSNTGRRFDMDEAATESQPTGHKQRIAKHIDALVEKLGTKARTTVHHSLDDVPENVRKDIEAAHKRGRKVRGWYENGEVHLFLPDIDSEYQAEKTIWHETVAHHGLRQLIGEENLNKLLKQLWLTHKDGEMGKWVTERMQKNGWSLSEAIEEYLAREAEKNPFKEPGLWQRLRWMVAEVLHKMGFASDPTISDIQYLFWLSQNRLNENDPMSKVKQQAFLFNLEREAENTPYVNMNAEKVEDIYNPEAEGAYPDGKTIRHSEETDEEVLERLEKEPKVKVYRAMQLRDGKLYPPMAAKVNGEWQEPMELGKWARADEHPELVNKDGKFDLDKGNGKKVNGVVYAPYMHGSTTMLNDQFKEAQDRPELVVVEAEMPESELTSGYQAEKSPRKTGMLDWKAGTIQGQLTGTRQVMLSRWVKPIRIVPSSEVAANIKEMIDGQVEVMPTNVVTPEQREELEKLGVKFVKTNNKEIIQEGEHKGEQYSSVYGKKASTKSKRTGRRYDMDIDDPLTYSAKEVYNDRLNRVETVFTEAYQDAMVSLKTAQNAIAKDQEIPDSQNAYIAENLMHGKTKNEQDTFNKLLRDPLIRTINKILNLTGMNWGDVDRYVYTKSGLERNREFYVRDWMEKEMNKRIRRYEDLNEDEQRIYDQKAAAIEQLFDDGDIDEEEKNKRLKQALQDSHTEYLNDLKREWQIRKRLWDKISFPSYLQSLDEFIRKNIDDEYDPSEHDYSGFRAMFGDENGKYNEDAIIDELMDTEDEINSSDEIAGHTTDTLWEQIRACTRYGLERYREAGMRSDEQIDQVEQMFHFYVPMRGFKESRGEDMYQYFTGKDSSKSYVGGLLKHAKGRGSEASYPISTIFAMTYKAISDCNQNMVNQKLYRLCQANPNDLIVLSDSWAVYNEVEDRWEESCPEIPDDASDEEVRQITLAWEEHMRELAKDGKAKKITGKARFDYKPMDKKKQSEHIVDVRINGQPKKMIVTSNPRMAQALNGQLRFERGKNFFSKWNAAIKNFMSSLFTSYSPTFALRNMFRDWTHFRMMLGVREGHGYAKQASKYYRQSLFKMVGLFKKYREGTLDESNEMERDFKDFMDNGGVTGYVHMQKIDDIQKEMKKLYKKQKEGKVIRLNNKVWDYTLGAIEAVNEGIENNARFATYRASRHYAGRTRVRSAYDAKEITVNFNRKGAGSKSYGFKSQNKRVEDAAKIFGVTSQLLGEGRIFFNATVQAIATTFKNFQHEDGSLNKPYIAKWFGKYALPPFMFGLLLPLVNKMLAAAFGGGDDDDPYANLPDWTRRKNLCFYIGNDNFITIPIGQELAAFLTLGDIAAGLTYAQELKPVDKGWDDEMLGVMSTFSPVDIETKVTDKDGVAALIPNAAARPFSVLAPIVAVSENISWTGRPIYKEDRYPTDKYKPEYQQVYQSTNPVLVGASKLLHEIGGGDDNARGKKWSEVNPGIVQYLWEQYTGGPGKVFSNAISIGKDAKDLLVNGEAPDFNIRKVEGLKAFVQQGDDRTQYYRTQAKFYKYQEDADKFKHDHDITNLEKQAKNDGAARLELERLQKTKEYQRYAILKEANRSNKKKGKVGLDDMRKDIKNIEDPKEKRNQQRAYNILMKEVVDMLDDVKAE